VEVTAAQPSEKEVIALVTLVALLDVLKWIATILSLWFSGRKLFKWIKRKLNKRKNHR